MKRSLIQQTIVGSKSLRSEADEDSEKKKVESFTTNSMTVVEKISKNGLVMRKSFNFKGYSISNWFPGHMGRGVSQVNRHLKDIDCAIEVHDARIPFTGRNPLFERDISQLRPHLLIFNKIDLVDHEEIKAITKRCDDNNKQFLFTNCKNQQCKGMRMLVPKVVEIIKESERYHRAVSNHFNIMIMGIPNVGKSSLINALRVKYLHKGKATLVGASPGITKSVLERIKICENPLIYVRDTPGILEPKIGSVEIGLKLALVNTIKEHLVGEEIITDYLLFRLNSVGNYKYVDVLQLDEPSDSIQSVLRLHAIRNNMILKRRSVADGGYIQMPDTLLAAKRFLAAYRAGEFGSLKLDFQD